MGTAERRERQKAELRQKILDAARDLFVSHGVEVFIMRKLAAHIEYSATAIYAYFPDKESLIRAVCEHDFSVLLEEGDYLLAVGDPVERLRLAARFYVEFALRHPHQYQFMFMSIVPTLEASESSLMAYQLCRETVDEAIAEGRLRPEHKDADLIIQALWSALHGVAALHIAGRFEMPIPRRLPLAIADTLIDALFSGFLVPESTPAKVLRAAKTRAPAKIARKKRGG